MAVYTAGQIHKLNKDPITDPHVLLIEIQEEQSPTVHRYTTDNDNVISNGETYTPATIEFSYPAYGEEPGPVTISVTNIHRTPGRALLNSRERIMVRLIVVDVSDPDTLIEDTLDLFYIRSAEIDEEQLEAEIGSVIDFQGPVPFLRVTDDLFPGVYA